MNAEIVVSSESVRACDCGGGSPTYNPGCHEPIRKLNVRAVSTMVVIIRRGNSG